MFGHTPIYKEFNGFVVRLMGPADLPLLIELGLPTCSFMHGRENVSEDRLRKNFYTFVHEFALEPNNEIYLVESKDRGLVAQVWLHVTRNRFNGLKELWIWDITVTSSHRREGIGHALMQIAEERARAQECDELWLLVSERNDAAKALYHDLGLSAQGHLMAKKLTQDAVPAIRPREMVRNGAQLGRLRSTDMDEIFALWDASGEYVHYRKTGREQPERFRVYLDRPEPAAFGLWMGERLVGVVLTAYDREKGWIERLAVHPDYRRAGMARVLMTTAMQSLRSKGAVVIAAQIEQDNVASQRFFAASGFQCEPQFQFWTIRYGHEY